MLIFFANKLSLLFLLLFASLPGGEGDLNEKGKKICHILEFFRDLSCAASSSQSCGKTLKARESEEEPWQSNEGVGQQFDHFRDHFATRVGCLVSTAYFRNAPSKEEIGAGVIKREGKAKDDRLEEMSGAPVLSPIFYLPPQGSQLKTLAHMQRLKRMEYSFLSCPTAPHQPEM